MHLLALTLGKVYIQWVCCHVIENLLGARMYLDRAKGACVSDSARGAYVSDSGSVEVNTELQIALRKKVLWFCKEMQ